jgi:hypothetical protein
MRRLTRICSQLDATWKLAVLRISVKRTPLAPRAPAGALQGLEGRRLRLCPAGVITARVSETWSERISARPLDSAHAEPAANPRRED